jgi:hypothetical protein
LGSHGRAQKDVQGEGTLKGAYGLKDIDGLAMNTGGIVISDVGTPQTIQLASHINAGLEPCPFLQVT